MMGMICGFKKGFLVNVPCRVGGDIKHSYEERKMAVSVKAMAAGLVVFANKA